MADLVSTGVLLLMNVHVLVPDPETMRYGVYGRLGDSITADQLTAYLPRGAIVAIRLLPDSAWPEVAAVVRQAAGRVVNAPVVLWTELLGRRRTVTFANRARQLPAAAVIAADVRSVSVLRSILTDPWVWPEQVVAWTEARVTSISPEARLLLHLLAEFASRYPTARALMADHGPVERQWRRAFLRSGLGSVGPWHAVLRSVAIGLELQRGPAESMPEFAFRFGYADPKNLRQRLRDVIGAGPPEIRTHLGGHWMLAEGLRRQRAFKNGQICPR
jgi:hypothetical protein